MKVFSQEFTLEAPPTPAQCGNALRFFVVHKVGVNLQISIWRGGGFRSWKLRRAKNADPLTDWCELTFVVHNCCGQWEEILVRTGTFSAFCQTAQIGVKLLSRNHFANTERVNWQKGLYALLKLCPVHLFREREREKKPRTFRDCSLPINFPQSWMRTEMNQNSGKMDLALWNQQQWTKHVL